MASMIEPIAFGTSTGEFPNTYSANQQKGSHQTQKLPSARQLVRDKRRNAQDGRDVFRVIPFRGSDFLAPIDQKTRTLIRKAA